MVHERDLVRIRLERFADFFGAPLSARNPVWSGRLNREESFPCQLNIASRYRFIADQGFAGLACFERSDLFQRAIGKWGVTGFVVSEIRERGHVANDAKAPARPELRLR